MNVYYSLYGTEVPAAADEYNRGCFDEITLLALSQEDNTKHQLLIAS